MLISVAIPSTTHIDRHFERFTKSALDQMAEQCNSKYIPVLNDHDFKQRLGVNLCAVVKPLGDGNYALVAVCGIYESVDEYNQFADGAKNVSTDKYISLIENLDLTNYNSKPDFFPKKKPETIADWLEIYLDSTSILPDGRVYKVKHFIASTGDLSIHVYPKDHNPPHFHVLSKQRRIDARFHISTLEHLSDKRGRISKKDIKKIQNFFAQNSHFLISLRSEYDRLQTD